MGGYGARSMRRGRADRRVGAPIVAVADAWHLEPDFIGALADGSARASSGLPASERDSAPVLLTAHSLPRRVADQEPAYLDQLEATRRPPSRRPRA